MMLIIAIKSSSRRKLRNMYNFGADYIYAKSEISPSNFDVCNRMATDLLKSTIKVNSLVFLAFTILVGLPFYKILHNEHELILPVIMPFIDPNTQNGFFANMANQMIHLCIGSFSIPIHNTFVCILKNNVLVTAAVIKNALNEFKIKLKNDKNFSKETICVWEFRNIVLKTLDYHKWVH